MRTGLRDKCFTCSNNDDLLERKREFLNGRKDNRAGGDWTLQATTNLFGPAGLSRERYDDHLMR